MRTMRAIYRRADLTAREAGLLRGIMIEVRKYIERLRMRGGQAPPEDTG
jgi:tRNA C32,U32 (ribose-2'-O)-methylase TrmJ